MAKLAINQHKRMAMGGNARGYAMGGPVLPAQAQATLPPQAGGMMRPAMPAQAAGMGMRAQMQPQPGMKRGGTVHKASGGKVSMPMLKTGTPKSPITKAKMSNGIPGMKKGGRA